MAEYETRPLRSRCIGHLTHTVHRDMDFVDRPICGKVQQASLARQSETPQVQRHIEPTCSKCLKMDPRFKDYQSPPRKS